MAAQERTPANTTPQDVLDFWFGEGVWGTAEMGDESPTAFAHKTPLWWGFKAVISSAISAHPAAMLVSACVVTVPCAFSRGCAHAMVQMSCFWLVALGLRCLHFSKRNPRVWCAPSLLRGAAYAHALPCFGLQLDVLGKLGEDHSPSEFFPICRLSRKLAVTVLFAMNWPSGSRLIMLLVPDGFGMQDFSGPISADEAAAMDASCRAFIPLIRAAGAKELDGEWSTADGRFAQMLLCDQFSRGAFRGSPEAFGYDPRAMELCRGLFEDGTYKSYTVAHWSFITTPCQHSEDPADHTIADAIMQFAKEKHADSPVCIQQVVKACAEHKAVVDKFGR